MAVYRREIYYGSTCFNFPPCFGYVLLLYGPNLFQRLCCFRCRTCFTGYLSKFGELSSKSVSWHAFSLPFASGPPAGLVFLAPAGVALLASCWPCFGLSGLALGFQ